MIDKEGVENRREYVQRNEKVLVIYTKIKRKENLKENLPPLIYDLFGNLACFTLLRRRSTRIIHKIELTPHSHYIIKTNKNEMIRNLEEENIIMKYRWHSHKHGYTDASSFTWTLIKTKREKVERRRRKRK